MLVAELTRDSGVAKLGAPGGTFGGRHFADKN